MRSLIASVLVIACGYAVIPIAWSADNLRDPFTFGTEDTIGGSGPLNAALVGVLWDTEDPIAIVGDDTVRIGDRVGVWTIVEIREDGIKIERNTGDSLLVRPGGIIP